MNVTNLKLDTHFLCGSTSATYTDANMIRNFNVAYNDVARIIWESADGWQYDDSNATTLPVAEATLVHNQQDYGLPSTSQRVQRVEVKDSGGDWQKLSQIDIHDISIAAPEFNETAGLPRYYDIVGRSLLLYPKPSSAYVTLASGLAVYVDRNVTEFPVTATTTEPGFAAPFHRILSYAAALDFVQDSTQRKFIAEQKERLERGLVRFYSKRHVERKASIIPSGKKNWRRYT